MYFGQITLLAALFFPVLSGAMLLARSQQRITASVMIPVSNAKEYFKCLTVQPKIKSLLPSAAALQLLWRAV
jgi:hypothetical protein